MTACVVEPPAGAASKAERPEGRCPGRGDGEYAEIDHGAVRRTVGQRCALAAFRVYQAARAGSVSPCRFYPSCSAYAVEAVERHGALTGTWLAVRRISRCRPLGGHGVDLVPTEGRGRRRGRSGR